MSKKDLITIDTSTMQLIELDGEKFLMDPFAEDNLIAWEEFKARVEEVDNLIKSKFQEAMVGLKAKKIEGESISVVRRFYGERFEITDPQMALAGDFAKTVTTVKADTKAIEQYEKDTGELPDGIKLRERTEKVSFVKVREKGEKYGR